MHFCMDEVRILAAAISSATLLPMCVRWCIHHIAGIWRS